MYSHAAHILLPYTSVTADQRKCFQGATSEHTRHNFPLDPRREMTITKKKNS